MALNVHSTTRQAHSIVRIDLREWNQIQTEVGRCDLETGGECEVHAPVTIHVPGGHPASSLPVLPPHQHMPNLSRVLEYPECIVSYHPAVSSLHGIINRRG